MLLLTRVRVRVQVRTRTRAPATRVRARLGAHSILLDKRCEGVEQDDHGVTARFADGSTARGSLAILKRLAALSMKAPSAITAFACRKVAAMRRPSRKP